MAQYETFECMWYKHLDVIWMRYLTCLKPKMNYDWEDKTYNFMEDKRNKWPCNVTRLLFLVHHNFQQTRESINPKQHIA